MKHNDIIDHHLYEVRLIVAIPDYGVPSSSSKYSALDAIVPQITTEDVVILGMTEKELTLTDVVQTTTLIAKTTTTATTALVSASRKARTLQDVPNGHQRWTKAERKELLRLSYQGISNAEIAKKLGRTEKAVALQIWHMEKGN